MSPLVAVALLMSTVAASSLNNASFTNTVGKGAGCFQVILWSRESGLMATYVSRCRWGEYGLESGLLFNEKPTNTFTIDSTDDETVKKYNKFINQSKTGCNDSVTFEKGDMYEFMYHPNSGKGTLEIPIGGALRWFIPGTCPG
ncbi:hypothetical protein FOZ63_005424 [Perkinsus olseni]|uniref:Uncharacterized protein n=1 Tax=Perkinsus olseni TaxID=32597 RepID=A0A7J6QN99_PEROL|nr:hypothetical protein FOZ63_005424 [Perkinsus olseni]